MMSIPFRKRKGESETRIARHKIEDEFGVSNQIAILVPKGDYESEKKGSEGI